MIRTEREYEGAKRELAESRRHAAAYRASLERENLDSDGIQRLMAPISSFDADLADEIGEYERLRSGTVSPLSLAYIGRFLIGLRIAKGWTQRDLARALDVNESTVSRDERNEYHGITVDRAQRIVETLEMPIAIMLAADYRTLLEQTQQQVESSEVLRTSQELSLTGSELVRMNAAEPMLRDQTAYTIANRSGVGNQLRDSNTRTPASAPVAA